MTVSATDVHRPLSYDEMDVQNNSRNSLLTTAHHKMTREIFWSVYGQGSEYDSVRLSVAFLGDELKAAETLVARVAKLGLPEQQIHADLHFQNGEDCLWKIFTYLHICVFLPVIQDYECFLHIFSAH